jgi:thymidylate kinase
MRTEFLGLPGVGKTTLRYDLLKILKTSNKQIYLSSEDAFLITSKQKMDSFFRLPLKLLPYKQSIKLVQKLINRSLMQFDAQNAFLAKHSLVLQSFLTSTTFQRMSESDRKVMIGSLLELGSVYESIYNFQSCDSVIIFEEGFVQKSFMFIDTKDETLNNQQNIIEYLNNIPLPDLIIYIEADVEACYQRMISRPDGLTTRLKKAGHDNTIMFLDRLQKHLELLVDWLSANTEVKLIKVKNNGNYKDTLDLLSSNLIRLTSY